MPVARYPIPTGHPATTLKRSRLKKPNRSIPISEPANSGTVAAG